MGAVWASSAAAMLDDRGRVVASEQVPQRIVSWLPSLTETEKHVCQFDAAASDILVRPGPRMEETARLIARCLAEKAPRRGDGA